VDDDRTADLGFARVDLDRAARTGDPEVVYGAGKTAEQVAAILTTLHERHRDRAVLATRLTPEAMDAAAAIGAEIHPVARAATLGPLPARRGRVGIVSAGTSDAPVAAEAALTVVVHGADAVPINDVGVAGLHRLLAVRDRLDELDVLIVVAGMEGALPSVVGGLVGVPVIAVPTSVGYGASFGGLAALLGMLNSCAPGVTVVNIDNGYGAGVAAARICRVGARDEVEP
jgi:NCAIR mutase (PurE)-related protein